LRPLKACQHCRFATYTFKPAGVPPPGAPFAHPLGFDAERVCFMDFHPERRAMFLLNQSRRRQRAERNVCMLSILIWRFVRSEARELAGQYAAILSLIVMVGLLSIRTLGASHPITLQPPAPIPAASSAAQPAGPNAVPAVPGLLDLIHCQGT
jgi:hypothetical protein